MIKYNCFADSMLPTQTGIGSDDDDDYVIDISLYCQELERVNRHPGSDFTNPQEHERSSRKMGVTHFLDSPLFAIRVPVCSKFEQVRRNKSMTRNVN